MELLYPDENFLQSLEEDLYNFNKDSCNYETVNMDLDSITDKLDKEYF